MGQDTGKTAPPSGGFFFGEIMGDKDPAVFKQAVKEAIKEWLDEQFAQFGRWTFYGLMSLALGGCAYLALIYLGLKK